MSETMAALGEGKSAPGKRPLDPELKVMGAMDASLASLPDSFARARAILWLVCKYGLGDLCRQPQCGLVVEGIENAG